MKRDDESNAKVERDEFHDFLSTAEPRPVPGRGRKEEIYAELRDEWLAGQAESRRRRQYIVSGIAASFVAAILLALVQNTDPGTEIPPPHAAMARITGNGTLVNGRAIEALWDADETLRFAQGDSILTGENAALAIAWNDGGSLRVRSATALKVVSHDRIELAEGEIYYDSRSHDTAGTAELAVDTPHGTIRHIGTQFLARVIRTVSGSA